MNNQEPDSTEDMRVPEVPTTDAEPLFPESAADAPDVASLDAPNGSIEDAVPALPVFGRPSVSPDGATILYTLSDNAGAAIRAVPRAGGPTRKVIWRGWDADWAPDGQRIAFVKSVR